jgi:hypothetical protein
MIRSIFKDENALLTNGVELHQNTRRMNKNSPSWESTYLYSYEKILHSKYNSNSQSCEESIAVVIIVTELTDAAGWLQATAHLFEEI